MPQYTETLKNLIGAVRQQKPNAPPDNIVNWLNWRMRQLLDFRTYWAGLITRGTLNCPAAYNTGTVSTTIGSTTVTGTATAWPTNDVVNTTLSAAVTRPGFQSATPASMTGINTFTTLYIGGANPEVVAPSSVTTGVFWANFTLTHSSGDPITCSSLVGRQFKPGFQYPVFTITAVPTATSMIVDQAWAGTALSSATYNIIKMYYVFATDLKGLMSVVDPQQGIELQLHYPLTQMNWDDPQRSSTNLPQYVVDHSVDANGNAVYELWPPPTTAYVLYFLYYKQWPDMKADGDTPPPFMNPAVIAYGAIADALRTKVQPNDPYYDLQSAQAWEGRFMAGAEAMMNADNDKFQQAYTWPPRAMGLPGGNTFWVSHDSEVWSGNW